MKTIAKSTIGPDKHAQEVILTAELKASEGTFVVSHNVNVQTTCGGITSDYWLLCIRLSEKIAEVLREFEALCVEEHSQRSSSHAQELNDRCEIDMPWLDETSSDMWSENEVVNAYLMPVDDLVGLQELDDKFQCSW